MNMKTQSKSICHKELNLSAQLRKCIHTRVTFIETTSSFFFSIIFLLKFNIVNYNNSIAWNISNSSIDYLFIKHLCVVLFVLEGTRTLLHNVDGN